MKTCRIIACIVRDYGILILDSFWDTKAFEHSIQMHCKIFSKDLLVIFML